MLEKPILFNGEMVRAILDGRKTQTRRVIKPPPFCPHAEVKSRDDGTWAVCPRYSNHRDNDPGKFFRVIRCPYGVPGDRLWVRETWLPFDAPDHFTDPTKPRDVMVFGRRNGAAYRAEMKDADSERCRLDYGYEWRPSITMPRWASRITLEITDIRVQRVSEITEEDAKAEDVTPSIVGSDLDHLKYRAGFQTLWDSINGPRGFGWEKNPYVWALTFRVEILRKHFPDPIPHTQGGSPC